MSVMINNPKLKDPSEVRVCPQCGAPLLSEVCQYCGVYSGEVATLDLAAEYPVVECKSGKFSFFGVIFPLIFAFGFLVMPMSMFFAPTPDDMKPPVLFMLPFFIIGFVALVITLKNILEFLAVMTLSKEREGVVYGYMDDTIAYNGVNGQKVKILVNTSEGKKFILLPLETTNKPYRVNSHVTVKLYKNVAMIKPESSDKKYNW